jgi:hypothetical protein
MEGVKADGEMQRGVVPAGRPVPAPRRGQVALVRAGSRALAATLRHPIARRAAMLGVAVGVGYRISLRLEATKGVECQEKGRERLPGRRTSPILHARIEYAAVSVTTETRRER